MDFSIKDLGVFEASSLLDLYKVALELVYV